MTWRRRYSIRSFLRNSIWFVPFLGLVSAIVFARLVNWADAAVGWRSSFGADGARALFGALVSAMLTFIVVVFSLLLVTVQIAGAQLSPRIIATALRDRVTSVALTAFTFTFTVSLALLARVDATVPQFAAWVATYSNVACIGVYLYLIDYVGRMLRPVSLLARVAERGLAVIEAVYPRLTTEPADASADCADLPTGAPSRTVAQSGDDVLLAFDQAGLVELARRADCVIELAPQVGDFVADGSALFRLYGGAGVDDYDLRQSVAFGRERTMEQDPEFALRIMVETASKALSPAINDPTTAVLALDRLHPLLRSLSTRRLDTGLVRDAAGRLRLVYRTPNWEDFVSSAVVEIRQFGATSIQVARRMRAMLDDLIRTAPAHRAGPLLLELELLRRSVERNFPEPEDRARAGIGDPQGMGGAAP